MCARQPFLFTLDNRFFSPNPRQGLERRVVLQRRRNLRGLFLLQRAVLEAGGGGGGELGTTARTSPRPYLNSVTAGPLARSDARRAARSPVRPGGG